MERLAGKRALITGAARGIGLAFAKAYVAAGARVVLADLDLAGAQAAAAALGPNAQAVQMDVADLASHANALSQAQQWLGGLDILINNAAIFTAAPILEINEGDFDRTFDINVKGPLFLMQAVAKLMVDQGTGGKIINMASQAGRRGESLVAVYCASKAAIISLTQSAGLNLIQHGINVNAIAPGVVDGAHWDGVDAYFAKYEDKPKGQKKQEVGAAVPFGRMGTAEDLVGMAIYLASEESAYVVGQTFGVDGGNWLA